MNPNRKPETDTLNHSSLQPWSIGEVFPYITYLREKYSDDHVLLSKHYIVSLAGNDLADTNSWDEAEALAALFKKHCARTIVDAAIVQFNEQQAKQDAELFNESASHVEGMKRQRQDYEIMHGDAEHTPVTMAEWDVDEAIAARQAMERDAEQNN